MSEEELARIQEHHWFDGALALRTTHYPNRTVDEYYDRGGQIHREITSWNFRDQERLRDRRFRESYFGNPSEEVEILTEHAGWSHRERERFLEEVRGEHQQIWELRRGDRGGWVAIIKQGQRQTIAFGITAHELSSDSFTVSFYLPRELLQPDSWLLSLNDLKAKAIHWTVDFQPNDLMTAEFTFPVERVEQYCSNEDGRLAEIYVADETHLPQRRQEGLGIGSEYWANASLCWAGQSISLWDSFIQGQKHPDMPKLCRTCRYVHGLADGGNLMICAVHPYGNGEHCKDFEAKQ